jgi:hypothetical protein
MGDDFLHAIGLLLTQLRTARRALEDIERSTARYNSFAFASALSAGPSFGAPPMFSGALKVWVVNINDLAPGAGGGFLEQLLGGVGRLIGGFSGGIVGGILGGLALPDMIRRIQIIAQTVDQILARLGINSGGADKKDGGGKKSEGPGLLQTLQEWTGVIKLFTALFQAGTGKYEEAQKTSDSLTPGALQWLQVVNSTSMLMKEIDNVVRGLTLLIPIVVGALAELLLRLDNIKAAILGLLQFFLQELFLLRGVLLATIFDTLAAAAKLGASILTILADAVGSIVTSIFNILKDVFDATVATIRFLADGLQNTIDALARWLVDTIGGVLSTINKTPVFREIVHIVDILPEILPPLVYAIRGEDAFKALDMSALKAAAALPKVGTGAPGPPGPPGSAALVSPPSIVGTLTPAADLAILSSTVKGALDDVNKQVKDTFGSASGALTTMGQKLDDAAKDKTFTDKLEEHTIEIRNNAKSLADAVAKAQDIAATQEKGKGGTTGLDVIAKAYEAWLSGNGLQNLLSHMTDYFAKSDTKSAEMLKDAAVGPTTVDRPKATIDIQDVVIELEPLAPAAPAVKEGDFVAKEAGLTHDQLLKMLAELSHEIKERRFNFSPDSLILQV